ncbi:hypothetical protein BDR06DRAFT_384001 [Suillus hirtellus]|nr:hypothetical protein BDR06DRAFT_384001 [Suillus hirtellus]
MLDRRLLPINRDILDVHVCCAPANPSTNFPPTTTNTLTRVSNYGSWQNYPVTLHSAQHYDPASCSTLLRWPDVRVHHLNSTDSTVFDEPSYQWQGFAIPPSSGLLSPTIPPHLAAESRFSSQPRGENIHGPSEHSPTNHSYFLPPHRHSSSPLLPCKWLHDDGSQICGFWGTLEALKAHCKTHLNAGPSYAQIECRWDHCDYKKRSNSAVRCMRRDCMWRHMCEVHLGMKRIT